MLTKIKNKQYPVEKQVMINHLLKNKIEEFQALSNTRNISISFNSESNFALKMNVELVDILLNNLIYNAIVHNVYDGEINIEISRNKFQICNTGKENTLSNDTIFNRFTKENSQSYGLGLSIVKQICDTHSLNIKYTKYTKHCLTILYVV